MWSGRGTASEMWIRYYGRTELSRRATLNRLAASLAEVIAGGQCD